MSPSIAGSVLELVLGVAFLCAAGAARARGADLIEIGVDAAVGSAALLDALSFYVEGSARVTLWALAGLGLGVAVTLLLVKLARRGDAGSERSSG